MPFRSHPGVAALQDANDDDLMFSSEDDVQPRQAELGAWRILVVDDDPDVHATTAFALRSTEILHRPLEFLHANSALEAAALLERHGDIAVILLDVVMEDQDAGLRLVERIRKHYGMKDTRIILRTGQPGYAPEMEAIRDYDINDYKTKSELTRNKLYTTLTAAIRSYEQIRTINASRRGLDMVVRATSELLALSGMHNFAAGVITQLSALLRVRPEGLICAQKPSASMSTMERPMVIAAAGRYADLVNQPVSEIADDNIRNLLESCLAQETHLYTAQGTALYFSGREHHCMAAFLATRALIDDDTKSLLELFCTNIGIGLDNTLLFAKLHEFAFFDTLTGLPNRLSIVTRLNECLASAERNRYTLAILDVDHFSEMNDALGHDFGDLILQAIAKRLVHSLPQQCQVARLSGDTFAVLGLAEHLLPVNLTTALQSPLSIDGQEVFASVTMGIAHLADIDGAGAEALKDASLALRRAKLAHRGEYSFFTRNMAVEMRERAKLLHALRSALDRQRLFLMYQPQIDLVTGQVTGVEALLRWRTEDGHLIAPDAFIPIAEHSGMIVSIGEWVLRTACRQQRALHLAGFRDLRMSINVSVTQLRHASFFAAVQAALADSEVDAHRIELEITESVAMEEADFISSTLNKLKGLGLTIAVDDFGTGFSSLSYLQQMKVDRLKIDRLFVADIAANERARRIPELVIELGRKLGFAILAEGVEEPEQAKTLRELGCHEAQGFHYGRPMEAASLLQWLNSYRERLL